MPNIKKYKNKFKKHKKIKKNNFQKKIIYFVITNKINILQLFFNVLV